MWPKVQQVKDQQLVTDLTIKRLGMALGRRISVKHKKRSQMV